MNFFKLSVAKTWENLFLWFALWHCQQLFDYIAFNGRMIMNTELERICVAVTRGAILACLKRLRKKRSQSGYEESLLRLKPSISKTQILSVMSTSAWLAQKTLRAMAIKITVFWAVTPHSPAKVYQCFGHFYSRNGNNALLWMLVNF